MKQSLNHHTDDHRDTYLHKIENVYTGFQTQLHLSIAFEPSWSWKQKCKSHVKTLPGSICGIYQQGGVKPTSAYAMLFINVYKTRSVWFIQLPSYPFGAECSKCPGKSLEIFTVLQTSRVPALSNALTATSSLLYRYVGQWGYSHHHGSVFPNLVQNQEPKNVRGTKFSKWYILERECNHYLLRTHYSSTS